ncbi:PREDICTED: uncharacterized protein LOC109212604 [Nicotiana attenuata]|uniref:uncharacterized protein LOC109212604 n=1 Tax=Nicotiana attenuata TaxID=49451 RepID=UPI000904CA96|nr:PREDICTED: uncharacterized protein LOC109212604 [Nicotiana attenuata]
MGDTSTPQIDHRHSLYLQPSDTLGAILINIKLTCLENYGLWSRSMRLALLEKNKLGFTKGTCVKSLYKGELADLWKRCNDIALSWIRRCVSQEQLPSIVHVSNAAKVWAEFKERFEKSNLTRLYHLWTQVGTLTQGYPPDFKSKRKPMQGAGGFKTYTNNATVEGNNSAEGNSSTESQSQGHYITEEEYKQRVDLLNKSSAGDCKLNMAGTSHYITSCKEKLVDINILRSPESRKVQVPTGNRPQITDIGSAIILVGPRIKNVLHVIDFKFNLLSVSKLTKDLVCTVKFFPVLSFTRSYSGKVMGNGRKIDDLYILIGAIKPVVATTMIK